MLSKFFGGSKMKTPYQYEVNPRDLGQGTRALGFKQPNTSIVYDMFEGGLPVHRTMYATQQVPQIFSPPGVVNVSLRGNGVMLSDQVQMQALLNYTKQNGGGAA